ncbi:MAG TPA: DNA mismatch repair protein MutS, partial [Ktedonobacterales bacterium]
MPTPARRQYLEIKARHRDALLMYQVGDFFEFFDDDARVAAQALQLVLTSRGYGPGEQVPLAGVPLHALDTYSGRLVAQGHKVAICEQVEPPGRGLVRREVTRVLTPGTLAEPGLLPAARDTYLAAVAFGGKRDRGAAGLAYVDASTGTFTCTQWAADELPDALSTEVARLRPAEVLVAERRAVPTATDGPSEADPLAALALAITPCPPHAFDREASRARLCRHFGTANLTAFGCEDLSLAASAAGAILAYLDRMNPALLRLITGLTTDHTAASVRIDARSWSALGVVEPARGAPDGPTLLATLDATRTAMGARLLRRTLLQPLRDRATLERRLDAVAALHGDVALRQRLGAALDGLPDLERLAGRVAQRTAHPRELHALAAALGRMRAVRAALGEAPDDDANKGLLAEAVGALDPCAEAVRLIAEALAGRDSEEPGRLLRRGYSRDLDALVDGVADSRRWIAGLEGAERERTGIKSLRVTFNKVFGYSIEVSHARGNADLIPADYERRQTLVNAERYITPALREHEARVFQTEERIEALERDLYAALIERLAGYHTRLRATAAALARLDVWLALAEVAVVRGYVRPELSDDTALEIRAGRHPVVEAALDGEAFIANDTDLGGAEDGGRVLLLTGPNMAGKSTYLRQIALIVLLAQVGSFVPAASARIGLVDRIFTRVGADDDLARGISTFMREMTETAYILRHATVRSLVILDEVGRGTSTAEGLALARAVTEFLCERVRAITLFATHFHELAGACADLP